MGFSELTIAGLLGHTGRGVTQRYIHLDKALVMAADKVAEEIERALDAGTIERRRDRKALASGGVSVMPLPLEWCSSWDYIRGVLTGCRR